VPHPLDILGASDSLLSPEERESLDNRGYAALGKLLSDCELKAARDRIQALLEEEGDQGGS